MCRHATFLLFAGIATFALSTVSAGVSLNIYPVRSKKEPELLEASKVAIAYLNNENNKRRWKDDRKNCVVLFRRSNKGKKTVAARVTIPTAQFNSPRVRHTVVRVGGNIEIDESFRCFVSDASQYQFVIYHEWIVKRGGVLLGSQGGGEAAARTGEFGKKRTIVSREGPIRKPQRRVVFLVLYAVPAFGGDPIILDIAKQTIEVK